MASIAEPPVPQPSAPMRRALFIATICAGSFLLFLVQPLVARMALPRLGGAPAVWNSAMLVYQALLLGGYAYAHLLGRLPTRTQAGRHIALLLLAALSLPIGLIAGDPPGDASPVFWVPWLFACSIGPLFLAVSAQAPLMQRWYVASTGGDPYPLYAASNLGSFAGLIAYPLLVEPLLPVAQQSALWSIGYALLLVLVGLCALALPRRSAAATVERAESSEPAPSWRLMGQWTLLAAVPSGLMLSTSLHLTTDIVAMPLLWVLPLGLYLLSFTVAFAQKRGFAHAMRDFAPFFLLVSAMGVFADSTPVPLLIAGLVLLTLFVVASALHARLFDLRPVPAHLTRFYLCMSVGGVIGGIVCALIAPLVFNWTYEHPLLILAAALLLRREPLFPVGARFWTPLTMAIAVSACLVISLAAQGQMLRLAGALAIDFVALFAIGRPVLFAALVACLGLSMGGWEKLRLSLTPGAMTRSYFGVYAVQTMGDQRLLVHGTTVHGIQRLEPGQTHEATSYYAPLGGAGLGLTAAPHLYGPHARIGIVGLGAGTLACYRKPGQDWRFYEIDPAIAQIAKDRRAFTFLADCAPDAPIAIGDARLVLAQEAGRMPPLDVLVIDAFSSDSVPMHLLTREAFALYGQRLAPSGLLLVHISNRFLDLQPLLAAAGKQGGWHVARRIYLPGPEAVKQGAMSSDWIALARDPAVIARLEAENPRAWEPLPAEPGFVGWSDDHASILGILKIFR
jgi:hypothetical protein